MHRFPILFALLLGLSFWRFPAHDPDLGWHLLGGRFVAINHAAPYHDFINAFSATWVDYHWLAQWLMFIIYEASGLDGLRVGYGILMAALMGLLAIQIPSIFRKDLPLTSCLSLFVSFLLLSQVGSIRPQMIGLFFIALALYLLENPRKKCELPTLFLISVITTNIHVYWIFIPLLFAAYRLIPRLAGCAPASPLYAWGGFVLLLSAGFISPYGIFGFGHFLPFGIFTNFALLFDYALTTRDLGGAIGELGAGLGSGSYVPALIILIALLNPLKNIRQNCGSFGPGIPPCIALILSALSLKFVGILGVVAQPRLVRSLIRNVWIPPPLRILLPPLLIVGALIGAITTPPYFNDTSKYLKELPLEACGKISSLNLPARPDGAPLRIMTHFNYGGWCKFAAEQSSPSIDIRVTTDGRTQFIPVEHYQLSFDLYRLNYAWADTLTKWAPDAVLVEKNRALGQFLIRAPQFWKLEYEDENFALFTPTEITRISYRH